VHATEVGGTHPALLEAMGFGNCVLTLAAPENIEAIGDAGIAYTDEDDLAEKLQRVLRDGSLVHSFRNRAQARVQEFYDWEFVVDQYERLFARMAGLPAPSLVHAGVDKPLIDETEKRTMSRSASSS
jgi:glycosyltransferase involved in cell wall biosynthesis